MITNRCSLGVALYEVIISATNKEVNKIVALVIKIVKKAYFNRTKFASINNKRRANLLEVKLLLDLNLKTPINSLYYLFKLLCLTSVILLSNYFKPYRSSTNSSKVELN
ncbi:hypothetical protein M436DRAFT_61365 [Aureobasidium namibiae CBS 147.97]|uniref:Uncharacterized protein n=1 Tax=Aureobasidium namibiae CBS 147.97 TaxID=1043004 RepID=A0A074WSE1_9PEZI|nr:uncharacterized protein M436DRAFT_61365 [Aureobasidium namibiae CBS 147.97]KEQ76085.1 hypothetical protein M436DRAFT_61365 [Aureobasidium namibiae CBS 147.97]